MNRFPLRLASPLIVGISFALFAGLTRVNAEVIFVQADAIGNNDGTSWENAFTDLQDALAASEGGDQIWVAAATYKPAGPDGDRTATFQLTSGVGLYGGFAGGETELDERDPDLNVTILSGDLNGDDGEDFADNDENSYHVVTGSDTDASAVLDGFTITAGHADGMFPDESGGGLDNLYGSPTVANCRFLANVAQSGGGVYNRDASPTLTNCAFEGDWGTSAGGGMYNTTQSSPLIINCTFIANFAGLHGGGMDSFHDSSPTLIGCTFSDNSAYQAGGGMHSHDHDHLTLIECSFRQNSVTAELGTGGGLYADGYEATLINCIFGANSATGLYSSGGAVYSEYGDLTLANCTFSGNTAEYGAAVMNPFSLIFLTGCTLSENHAQEVAGGAYTLGGLTLFSNCILWGNSDSGGVNEASQVYMDFPAPNIHFSCIQGWTGELGGIGNTGEDPLLADANGPDGIPGTDDDDLQLLTGSPSIDAGANDSVPDDDADLDGDGDTSEPLPVDLATNPRFVDDPSTKDTGLPGDPGSPVVDMGAYEFQVEVEPCEGDANGDGTVDPLDSGFVLSRFGCTVGAGDPECDTADQNGDGLVDPLDSGFVLARFGDCP